jgi:hypothetical protein
MLQYATREEAAQAAGINPATLYRWQKDPQFQQALLEARREVFGQAMGRLQHAARMAVDTLIGIMNDPEATASGRVQASKCVLELSRKSLELDDVKIRLAELESWKTAKDEGSDQHA